MRTDRPVESTGTGPQELLRGDDHPRRAALTLQLTNADMAALQRLAPSYQFHLPAELATLRLPIASVR